MHTRFIELAGEINGNMPKWVVNKITDALNDDGKSVKGSRILICGIAYKKNVDDMRESPSLTLMSLLNLKGAQLAYSDPHVPVFPKLHGHEYYELDSVELTAENLEQFDCVVIATAHKAFDYDLIKQHSKLVIDSRGVYRQQSNNIVRA